MIKASAPGKLVVVGEYAVLDGAPAMAVAVDRRVHGGWQRREDGRIVLRLTPLSEAVISLPVGSEVCWERALGAGLDHLRPALRALRYWIEWLQPAWLDQAHALSIDSTALYASPEAKYGLGSSAAVAAVVGAMASLSRWDDPPKPQALHQQLWSRWPQTRGSGLDLACAINGGVVEYRIEPEASASAQWDTLEWPSHLQGLIVWSGESASSPNMVGAYRAWKRDHPEAWSRHFNRLSRLAEQSTHAFKINDMDGFFEGLTDYAQQVGTMGGLMGARVMTPMHEHLSALASKHGVMYKPSGAGGGDVGIVLSTDPEALHAMGEASTIQGLSVMPLTPTAAGLALEAPGLERKTEPRH